MITEVVLTLNKLVTVHRLDVKRRPYFVFQILEFLLTSIFVKCVDMRKDFKNNVI